MRLSLAGVTHIETAAHVSGVSIVPSICAIDDAGKLRREWRPGNSTVDVAEWASMAGTPLATVKRPKVLTPNQMIDLLVSVIGVSEFLSAWEDVAVSMRFWRIKVTVARDLDRDTPAITGGLAALIAAGHMTAEQRTSFLAAWPTE